MKNMMNCKDPNDEEDVIDSEMEEDEDDCSFVPESSEDIINLVYIID